MYTAVMEQRPQLMVSATAGDADSFAALIEPLLDPAYRLAAVMLADRSSAEDAVQEASIKAWRKLRQLRGDLGSLRPWFLSIVANECRDQRRSRWWSVIRRADAPDELADTTPATDPATVDLRRALYSLPHDQRFVLILRYYLDLSYEEVGQTLGISTKAAMSRTYRAVERLRLSPEVLPDE